uniref:Sphingomyelin phosphodiesterase C-terminal domain-containing protein n=1 Tax=Euplotes crassus TaxID=5936 RepID=A0A7S3NZK7_EUPCR|mmetsp:Transcript_38421/g.37941  ORF Transcript_38421/g.37941 Transcript_38421/m.37941 type:complete len:237 (+) Transcript_38421:644-1354(+)
MHQLEWLENLLRQMEIDGEIAIFIGHMSPGTSDCISEVSSRLRAIFDRFQHIIRLNLFGHTHREEYEVIRSVKNKKPIGVNYLTPSMTTLTDHNPSFRVITLDAETKLPLKMKTYTFDIVEANKNDAHAFFKEDHEMTKEYEMKDLSPQSFLDLSKRFMDEEDLTLIYSRNMFAGGPGSLVGKGCNAHCRRLFSCRTSNSVFSDSRKCMHWRDMTDVWVLESYLFDFMNGRWVSNN